MPEQGHSDRTALLRARGGFKAAMFWLARRALRLDVYRFYAIALTGAARETPLPLRDRHAFLVLQNMAGLAAREPRLVTQLDARSGCGVANVIRRNGRIYAITHGDRAVAQLRIDLQRSEVDTPLKLLLDCGEKSAFLSFLYTDPACRRGGWATKLISLACADLAREGFRACVCHVQATNVRSINTFSRCGWNPIAWLLTTPGGRLLGVHRVSRAKRLGVALEVSRL